MKVAFIAAIAIAIGAAGCSGPQLIGSERLTVVAGSALPMPQQQNFGADIGAAVIGPGDELSVEVFGVEELTRKVRVNAGGNISLPLIGVIKAAGMTPEAFGQLVELKLRQGQFVRNPDVAVNLSEAVSQMVTVDGEVRDPGLFPVGGPLTLMRAIAKAKGLTEFARASHVVIFRRVGERNMAALYDLRAIRQGIYDDPQVYANDIVVVGESQARRLFRDVIQGSGLLTTPIIALLQSS